MAKQNLDQAQQTNGQQKKNIALIFEPHSVWVALISLAIWLAVTFIVALWATPVGENAPVIVTMGNGASWSHITGLVCALLLLAIFKIHLTGFASLARRDWLLMWLPMIYVLLMLASFFKGGFAVTPTQTIAILAANTAILAASEEIMFRGILWEALSRTMRPALAIALCTGAFAIIHSGNALIGSDLINALAQSFNAIMSGLFLLALRIRTRSIYPSIVFHFLWNFAVILTSTNAINAPTVPSQPEPLALLMQFALLLPIGIYGLFLMRKMPVRN